MYIHIDIILWIFLQNIILLPFDYLIETDEFQIFENAEKQSSGYIISYKDLYDVRLRLRYSIQNNDIYFESFENMLTSIYTILPNNCIKKNLIKTAKPILNRFIVENMLMNCHINID